MHSWGTLHTLLLFVGRYKAPSLHEQMLALAVTLQSLPALFSRGSSCLLKMLVDNEALGQSDSCSTLEWLNKSRWVSLLWVSPVSHLFIAPLSLIPRHCLRHWHKSIWSVLPTWCLVPLPLCLHAMKPTHLFSTCASWAQMLFEVPNFTGKCALVTLLHVSQFVLVRESFPSHSRAKWFLTPFFFSGTAGKERLWPGSERQLFSLQQVAWRKVLTRPQTVGLSMQGQATSNSFKDKQMDPEALTHTS